MNVKRLLFLLSAAIPLWVVNPANPPDILVNWKTNQAWTKHGGVKSIDSLGITTSRASVKQVVDSNGNWSQVAANVTARSDLGRSTEEARTNSIRNNTMQGAIAGADSVEHLTNGNFASLGAGWTTNINGGAITFTSGQCSITGNNTDLTNYIAQQITGLVIGRSYVLSITAASLAGAQVLVGTSAGNGSIVNGTGLVSNGQNSATADRLAFTATATSHWISVSRQSSTPLLLTSVSVQDGERAQNGGFTANPLNAAQSTLQNGWEWTSAAGTGTATWNSGAGSVTLTGDGTHGAAISQSIATVAGVTYTISADISVNALFVQVGTAAFGATLLNTTGAVGTAQKFQFTATGTTSWVTFAAKAAAASYTVANVSVQSAGAWPTNWGPGGGSASGLTVTINGVGTQNGVDYIEARFSGTTNNAGFNLWMETAGTIVAAAGQTWTGSMFVAMVAGTLTNVTSMAVDALGTGGTSNLFQAFTPTASFVRYSATGTLSSGVTALRPDLNVNVNNASAVDVTLRIGWPQFENNSINSTVASATVAAGGTGYTVGDVLQLAGGTGTAGNLVVATVSAGVITGVTVKTTGNAGGSYSVFPPSPAAVTLGTGTGATFNLTPVSNAANAFATSPIKTTSVALLRNADVTVLTGVTIGSAYSLFAQFTPQAPASYTTNQGITTLSDGTSANRSGLYRVGNGGFGVVLDLAASVAGAVPANTPAVAQNSQSKLALSFGSNVTDSLNGAAPSTAVATVFPTTAITQWHFGDTGTGGGQFDGIVAVDAIWLTQAVPSAQLKSMTA